MKPGFTLSWRGCWPGVVLLLLSLTTSSATFAQDEADISLRVRAAFLFNFARFTSWPEAGQATTDGRMVYCVVGSSGLSRALRAATEDKQVSSQPIEVRMPEHPSQSGACDVVYLNEASTPWLASLRTTPALVVGEGVGFARDHGMVGFFVRDGRLRFAIHLQRVDEAGLQISSRLLGLATLVGEGAAP